MSFVTFLTLKKKQFSRFLIEKKELLCRYFAGVMSVKLREIAKEERQDRDLGYARRAPSRQG